MINFPVGKQHHISPLTYW